MKTPQSKSSPQPKAPVKKEAYGQYQDRNLAGMKDAESLVPTDAEPVSLHKRMAGAC